MFSEKCWGFIYQISRISDDKKYIGLKAFHTKPVWTAYTGSSTTLNADIKELGKDAFKFEMLYTCPSFPWAKWAETHEHFKRNVVFSDEYYNDRAGIIRWAPSKSGYAEMESRLNRKE